MRFTNTVVITLALTFLGTLGIVAWSEVNGVDVNNLIYLVMVALGAAFPGVVNGKSLKDVERNTNGNMNALLERNRRLEMMNTELASKNARLERDVMGIQDVTILDDDIEIPKVEGE